MLNKKEKAVMKSIYYNSVDKNGVCLLRPIEVLNDISPKIEIKGNDLNKIIRDLELDDYYEVVESKKKGETVWCFTLHQKGHAFYREILNEKRWVYFKISMSVALAIGVFFLKLILDAIARG